MIADGREDTGGCARGKESRDRKTDVHRLSAGML